MRKYEIYIRKQQPELYGYRKKILRIAWQLFVTLH